MQIDIASHIEKLLFEHETLIIPAFGGFTATRAPASVDFVGGAVAPPTKTLSFNENLTVDDGILVHDVAHTHQISNEEARKAITDFVDKTKESLSQREIVNLTGVGRLYKNYAQKIQFLPDTTNFNTESYGLPPLQFSPLARARETTESVPASSNANVATPPQPAPPPPPAAEPVATVEKAGTPQQQPDIEREQRRSPMRSMAAFFVVLLLFAIAVSIYLINRNRSAHASGSDTVVETPDQKPAPQPVLPGPSGLISEAQQATENEKTTAKPAPGIENEQDDTADEVDEAAAKRAQAIENQAKTSPKTTPKDEPTAATDGRRCVVIIGTYQNKDNADKLLAKLRKAGYDTYYRVVKGHQVGVEFQYQTMTEVQDKLKALQALTGEDDLWIKKK